MYSLPQLNEHTLPYMEHNIGKAQLEQMIQVFVYQCEILVKMCIDDNER